MGFVVLVCGSRDWTDRQCIRSRLAKLPPDAVLMHGGAKGADLIAEDVALAWGHTVSCNRPDYDRWPPKVAPLKRNIEMLEEGPDLVIAFQRNGSRGTQHTIDEARRRGIPVEVHRA